MEPNENQLSSYYHHHQQQLHHHQVSAASTATAAAASPTNGLLPSGGDGGAHMVYPHSVPSAAAVTASPLEPAKRKRGRPRKYGTPEQALAAKKAATASSHSAAAKDKKDHAGASPPSYSGGSSSKKSQLAALGNSGQGFTPHVINVQRGEDVGQKIMMFVQQSKREVCILSAAGTISDVSLSPPATPGGTITYYEGLFDIISISGSYVRTENGTRSGGMSVCLSTGDGHIIGGGVGGPIKAAGPVQVIVGSFMIDTKKDFNAGVKSDGSAGIKLSTPVGVTSPTTLDFRSAVDSVVRTQIRANDGQQGLGGGNFMIQPRGFHVTPSRPNEWRAGPDGRTPSGYDLTGRAGLVAHNQSPENGDYDQIRD